MSEPKELEGITEPETEIGQETTKESETHVPAEKSNS